MRSMNLYDDLRNEDGSDVGLKRVGSIRLGFDEDQIDEFRVRAAMAKTLDLPIELIGPDEIKKLFPLLDTEGVIAGAYLPTDGHVDPSMATQAMASAARDAGASICRQTTVTGLRQIADGWIVETDKGRIECEVVVNAAGQWARKVGELAGVRLPIVPLQHQYVITEPLDEVIALKRELPVLRDPRGSYYVRQEGSGLTVGPFEPNPLTWQVNDVPDDFEGRLLPGNLDQILEVMLKAGHRIPVLHDAGLKTIINGPDGYTPDGRCLMGEIPGRRGLFVLAGFSIFGIVFGGGAGAYAAEWIVNGQPSESLWELDVRRFGPFAETTDYVVDRAREVYEREYAVHFPHEELPAGRPCKTDALYDALRERGAVFGARFGWERPLWFGEPSEQDPGYSFRVPGWHEPVGRECQAVRNAVGVMDQSSFAKYEVSGPGSRAFLDRLCANRLPSEPGRIALTQMLTQSGGIECDVTVTWIGDDRYYVVSAAAAEEHDLAWIEWHAPRDSSVVVTNLSARLGVLTIAGPLSRELMSRISPADFSKDAHPFFRSRELDVAGVRCRVMRLSYVGELGFELHHPCEYSRRLYRSLIAAGADLGIVDFGYHALDSMRLEKGYRLWGADITQEHTALEAGFERLIDWDKDFIGKDALLVQRESGLSRQLVTLHHPGPLRAISHQYEPLFDQDKPVGWTLAGGWGHTVDRGIALAYLPPDLAEEGTVLELELLEQRIPVEVTHQALYDPANERLRS